ncbi:CAP domain-containing protein [Candidatus Roizmanbacteria bacterium]|nr:CAP domain-containing protein [Candidatus Roizmanbacteria bacterium]
MQAFKNLLHHLFIPQEGNNYRAKALHVDFLTYYLLFALFLTFGFKILYTRSGDILGFATDITIDRLYQLTNTIRQQYQLSTLTFNEQLSSAAQKKASDMFAKNYWSHYGPDGVTPWDFILSSGYRYEYAGENLAKNFLFSQGVVDAWMNSSSHRDNILRKEYSEVGFGVANGVLNGEETTIVVEMFGKPLTAPLVREPEIRPNTVEAKAPITAKKPAIQQQPAILAQKTSPQNNNIGKLSFNSSLIFLTFLLLALILDFYFVTKLRIIRITGKNIAHMIFIGFIFVGLLLLTKGSIL